MSLKNLRAEIRSTLGIEHCSEEEKIEIRPGVFVYYNPTPPMFAMNNFYTQSIGMWLWKYALCPKFEEKVKADDFRKTITLCYPGNRLNTRVLGQIINSMRSKTARIQYGDFGRAYGWKWNGKEDLATSMWLLAKTWMYHDSVIKWNHDTAVAPGDGSRSAIEEELMTLDFAMVVDAYYVQRKRSYREWHKVSSLTK